MQVADNGCSADDVDDVFIVAAAEAAVAAAAADGPAAAAEANQAEEGASAAPTAAAPDELGGEHPASVAPEVDVPVPVQDQAASPAAPTRVPPPLLPCFCQEWLLPSLWSSHCLSTSFLLLGRLHQGCCCCCCLATACVLLMLAFVRQRLSKDGGITTTYAP